MPYKDGKQQKTKAYICASDIHANQSVKFREDLYYETLRMSDSFKVIQEQ